MNGWKITSTSTATLNSTNKHNQCTATSTANTNPKTHVTCNEKALWRLQGTHYYVFISNVTWIPIFGVHWNCAYSLNWENRMKETMRKYKQNRYTCEMVCDVGLLFYFLLVCVIQNRLHRDRLR